ncbi:sensor histidine kinase [Pseudoblastomonas halimionae]|uniref:histidine kinase n=1 Tax=Alteriqipengyuania halimionae TaxID=1926630 RepID=A0A6I4U132_9SPHN|nr:HAMP domain-containing sensor histidine kinase [Alteriqipengyuania halimionae]MXP09456.1 sensor histidine kinase [Alteriqipengyuania halimionae]
MNAPEKIEAHAFSDRRDRLVSADEPLAGLQLRCGGEIPGVIAIPALLEEVRKARRYGLKIARSITARDDGEAVSAWIELTPLEDGCEIYVQNWQSRPLDETEHASERDGPPSTERALADFTAILDADQRIIAAESEARDLKPLLKSMERRKSERWTEFVHIDGLGDASTMPWRLLDGAHAEVDCSERKWFVRLFPRHTPSGDLAGLELTLTADRPLERTSRDDDPDDAVDYMIARDVAPALRQPLARIIANAETIRARLAGPLPDQYSDYAADIASAGQHLMALLDDLSDLEVVEATDFRTAPDKIDVADVARRAAGIVGVRAREKDIELVLPEEDDHVPATAEFRRVLQILLNLLGNAIRYSPEGSRITIELEQTGRHAFVHVSDDGDGIPAEKREKIFDKFERLGRSGDGGSGLGLYISRRLARAMGGELAVTSEAGEGGRFTLTLPLGPDED